MLYRNEGRGRFGGAIDDDLQRGETHQFSVWNSEAGEGECDGTEGQQGLAPDKETPSAAPASAVPASDNHPHVLTEGDPYRPEWLHVSSAEAHRLQ